MEKVMGNTKWIVVSPESKKAKSGLEVFHLLKGKKSLTVKDIARESGLGETVASKYLRALKDREVVKLSEEGPEARVALNKGYKGVLGIGFSETNLVLSVIDLVGNVLEKEYIEINPVSKMKGRKKEINEIVKKAKTETKLRKHNFYAAAVAIPEKMFGFKIDVADMFTYSFKRMFGCECFATRAVTSSGYGERDNIEDIKNENIIYVHADIGSSIVIKKEEIVEPKNGKREDSTYYLRPWQQYSVVDMTKKLIDKGVGTDVVKMLDGDVDKMTLEVVLKAADKNDELAADLVKRSAHALGVRIAYLVNIFGISKIIFGGGIEKDEGGFSECVKESARKFLLDEVVDKFNISSSKLGAEAPSIGAADLCRRQLFIDMEV